MRKYKKIFNEIELIILTLCTLCILLIIFQDPFREESNSVFLNYTKLYKQTNYEPEMDKEFGYIIFRLENKNFPDITVVTNGKNRYKFRRDEEIKLKVYNNDIVEIDSFMYDEEIKIKIVGISENVLFPKLSSEITVNKGIDVVGNVILN